MRTLFFTLALTASLPALACNSFGPDFDPTPCPDVPVEPVPPPNVRIPLAPWTGPIDLGTNPDGSSRGIAVVSGMVIDDFAVLFAILPNSKKLIGVSAQCIQPVCGQLGQWARRDLEQKIDLLLRATHADPSFN
jgi:hypothetical protein